MNKSLKALQFRVARGLFGLAGRIAPVATGRYVARRFITPAAAGRGSAAEALLHAANVQRGTLPILGEDIATYVWGDPARTPYVLLGHGWSSYALRFAAWIPRLCAAGYAVVGFDQTAHGLSSGRSSSLPQFAEVTRGVGRHFGRPAAFIGHSLGATAVPFAEEEAWRPARFVLIAPLTSAARGARRVVHAFGVPDKVFAPFEEWLSERSNGTRFDDYHASLRIPYIDRPALIVHDRLDREIPWEEGVQYASLWPGARLFTTEKLGHTRMVDHASVIDEAMAFLGPARRVEPTGSRAP